MTSPESNKTIRGVLWAAAALLAVRTILAAFTPLADPTEGRYAEIARHMVVSGNWTIPHIWVDGECVPFLGKPPAYFWAAAACMKLFGTNEVAARLPSILAFGLTLLMLMVVLNRYHSAAVAQCAGLVYLSSIVLFVSCGLAIVDLLFTFAVAGALLSYYAFCKEEKGFLRTVWSLLTFALLGLGFMTKGPAAIVLFGLPVLVWTLRFRRWDAVAAQNWYWGVALFAIITVPWFITAEDLNPGFTRYFFINENVLRFITPDYGDKYGSGHEYFRGAAIGMMIIAAVPWSFWWLYAMIRCRRQYPVNKLFSNEPVAFFFYAVLLNTLFWSLARQLLMTYLYPMVPLFAAGLALWIQEHPIRFQAGQTAHFKKIALGIAVGTLLGLAASIPYVSQYRSAKRITQQAMQLTAHAPQSIYFIDRVPFSGYFYGGPTVIAHPDHETLTPSITENNPIAFIVANRYRKRIPQELLQNAVVVANTKKYVLLQWPPTVVSSHNDF